MCKSISKGDVKILNGNAPMHIRHQKSIQPKCDLLTRFEGFVIMSQI